MKYFFAFIFLLALNTGCREKKSNDAMTEKKLMEAMKNYLDAKPHPGVVFTVEDVIFFHDKKYYRCEFRVKMQTDKKDTTGTMVAIISNDFSNVERSQ